MKKTFLLSLFLLALTFCVSGSTYAQTDTGTKAPDSTAKAVTAGGNAPTPATAITATTSPVDLAKAAVAAFGGDKFRTMKNVVLRGSVDLYGPASTQSVPGGFVIVTAGDKFRMEVDARPLFSFKQIFDGQQSYSSLPGAQMAPVSKFGIVVLNKFDQAGVWRSTSGKADACIRITRRGVMSERQTLDLRRYWLIGVIIVLLALAVALSMATLIFAGV